MTTAPLAKTLETLLGAAAVCAALLLGLGYALGPGLPDPGVPGLTAAAVLATDGMAADGVPDGRARTVLGDAALGREAAGKPPVAAERPAS